MSVCRLTSTALLIAAFASAAPALAQPGWGRPGWGSSARGDWGASRMQPRGGGQDSREGRVDTAHFVADDAGDALGHGPVAVVAAPEEGGTAQAPGERAYYEAAVIDQLVKAGYDTTTPDPDGGQVAELRIVRETLVPQEARRKPVSGEAMVGVSNRGTTTGMAIAVDLSKPRKALISTRLEARLRDRATGKALWEGRAEIATREGDAKWTDQAIAGRLAAALFARFPEPSEGRVASQ